MITEQQIRASKLYNQLTLIGISPRDAFQYCIAQGEEFILREGGMDQVNYQKGKKEIYDKIIAHLGKGKKRSKSPPFKSPPKEKPASPEPQNQSAEEIKRRYPELCEQLEGASQVLRNVFLNYVVNTLHLAPGEGLKRALELIRQNAYAPTSTPPNPMMRSISVNMSSAIIEGTPQFDPMPARPVEERKEEEPRPLPRITEQTGESGTQNGNGDHKAATTGAFFARDDEHLYQAQQPEAMIPATRVDSGDDIDQQGVEKEDIDFSHLIKQGPPTTARATHRDVPTTT